MDINVESYPTQLARAQKEKLRDIGKITDDELETFRNTFFTAQDSLFTQQETLIERQEDLRLAIRFFK